MEGRNNMSQYKKDNGLKTTLKARIMRFFVISVIETIIIFSAFFCITLYKVINSNAKEEALGYAESYSDSISESMNLLRYRLEKASENPDLYNMSLSLDERKKLLSEVAETISFKDLSIAMPDGKTYNDTDISEREYFKSAMNGVTYISSPVIRKTDGKLAIIAGAKINSDSFNGVIYGGIDTGFFSSKIQNIKFGKAGYGFIVDKTGTIIGHPDIAVMEQMINPIELAKSDSSYSEYASVVGNMIKGQSGTTVFRMNDNKKYLIGYAPVDGSEGWSIGVMIPYSETMSDINIAVIICLIISAVLLGYGIPFALSFSRKIYSPIVSVSQRLKGLADGDLLSPCPENKRGDETQMLADALSDTINHLNSYIGDISNVLVHIADNDLTVESNVHYAGDFVKIKDSLEVILDSLNSTLADVGRAVVQVQDAAAQVAAGASSLSQNTATEAGTMEEFSATLYEVSRNVKATAENAKKASDLTSETNNCVQSGNRSMSDMLEAINDIESAAEQISKIITVIDDIAFQTNILALNAAVEAARAGTAGKGFAVVADEVRNLAAKSAEAAKQTGKLIQNAVDSVKKGTSLADVTAQSLNTIVENVDKVTEIINSISLSTEEQSLSINQINSGMDQINNSIQNTSATAQESAASSEELSGQANALNDRIKKFKIK
jgi:methyl-accepting chemotaxis protein